MSYGPEWIVAAPVLWVALLRAPPLALIALGVLLLAALATLLALAGAIAATPYLLFRSASRRWAHHHAGRRNAGTGKSRVEARAQPLREELTVNTSANRPPTSTEPLVEALTTRLRRVDLIGWAQITARAEEGSAAAAAGAGW
jgi:hypothetical protein